MGELSRRMQEVIDLMDEGWSLCSTFHSGSWLQKNGCGMGGETKRVHANTVHALLERGLIVLSRFGFTTSAYKRTTKCP